MRKTNELSFPIFLECRTQTSDKFWSKIFENLAYNKAPLGVFIKNNHLCYHKNKKNVSYYISSNKSSNELFMDIYEILHSEVGIISPNQKVENINKCNTTFSILKKTNITWSDIKKKHIKDILFELFVIKLKHKYNLSVNESKKLLSLIQTSFTFKKTTNNDVCFEKGEIQSIKGLFLSDEKCIFSENIFNEDIVDDIKIVLNINLLINLWTKYLNENIRKKK